MNERMLFSPTVGRWSPAQAPRRQDEEMSGCFFRRPSGAGARRRRPDGK
jgi:hypothetical protein